MRYNCLMNIQKVGKRCEGFKKLLKEKYYLGVVQIELIRFVQRWEGVWIEFIVGGKVVVRDGRKNVY